MLPKPMMVFAPRKMAFFWAFPSMNSITNCNFPPAISGALAAHQLTDISTARKAKMFRELKRMTNKFTVNAMDKTVSLAAFCFGGITSGFIGLEAEFLCLGVGSESDAGSLKYSYNSVAIKFLLTSNVLDRTSVQIF